MITDFHDNFVPLESAILLYCYSAVPYSERTKLKLFSTESCITLVFDMKWQRLHPTLKYK